MHYIPPQLSIIIVLQPTHTVADSVIGAHLLACSRHDKDTSNLSLLAGNSIDIDTMVSSHMSTKEEGVLLAVAVGDRESVT